MNEIQQIKYNREVILFHSIFLSSCKIYKGFCVFPTYHELIFTNNNDDNVFTIFSHNLMKIDSLKKFTMEFMVNGILKRYNTDNKTVKIF